jgi:hypothetical protein
MHSLRILYANYLTPFIEAFLISLLIIYATNPQFMHSTVNLLSHLLSQGEVSMG